MDEAMHLTTNPDEIKEWAKERGGVPAVFTAKEESNPEPKLKINFGVDEDERTQEMTWERFFEELDALKLAFKYKLTNRDGRSSFYYEFVNRGLESA